MRTWLTLILGVVLLGTLGGCEDVHVGRLCFIQRDVAEGSSVVVNPQALECPSRLCLHYKDPNVAGVDALDLCTTECGSDDDCGGETADDDPAKCKTGFKCAWPVVVGPLCCKRMCVCADLLQVPDGGVINKPPSCEPTPENQQVCQNL